SCVVLLFLRKANLSKDLTARLKGQVVDPGKVTLRSGGVGGEGLEGGKPNPGDKPAPDLPPEPRVKVNPSPPPMSDKPAPAVPGPPDLDAEAARLSTLLVSAAPARQAELVKKFKDAPGVVHTQALATAIPRLPDRDVQRKAREAL